MISAERLFQSHWNAGHG